MAVSGMDHSIDPVRPDSVEELTIIFQLFSFEPCPTVARTDQNSPFQVSPRRSQDGPGDLDPG